MSIRTKVLQSHSPNCRYCAKKLVPPVHLNTWTHSHEFRDAIGRAGNGMGERWAVLKCLSTQCRFKAIVAVRDLENIIANLVAGQDGEAG